MLSYSTEAAFFLTLFELVVSGLPLGALLWSRFREKRRFSAQGVLITGFGLLCVGFAAHATYLRVIVPPAPPDAASHGWLLVAADGARAAAAVALGAALLLMSGRPGSKRFLQLLGCTLVALALFRSSFGPWMAPNSIDPSTPLRLAEVAVLLLGSILLGWPPGIPGLALLLLGLGRASALVGIVWPRHLEACWSTGSLLSLAGLILLALALERVNRGRLLHYVLRFNVTFLSLAISLTLVLAEIGRRQFFEFSAAQIRDVAEFARGHLVQETRLGASPEAILSRPAISAGLIREFGHNPDLRRIELELGGRAMALQILPSGEIEREFWTGQRIERPAVTPEEFALSLLLRVPVEVDAKRLGQVSLFHSVLFINSRIGQQMQVAFAVFTLFVVVGSIVTGVLVLVADRTILRQERELAEAQKRLLGSERLASIGALADGVAHEINNPVGVLVARSDYLLSVIRDKPYAAEIQEDLETIRRQSQRVAKTVQGLLASTRSARHLNDAVSVAAVVESAIKLVRPVVRDRGVTFEYREGSGDLRVWGDRDRLEQVFINLLSNAAQAIPGRGAVTVEARVRAPGGWIDVDVTDTGTGIEPEYIGRIFDRFFTTKEPGTGSGLGLSIVSGIVRDHGGYIEVESTLGKGSRFHIALRAYDSGIDPSAASRTGSPMDLPGSPRSPSDG